MAPAVETAAVQQRMKRCTKHIKNKGVIVKKLLLITAAVLALSVAIPVGAIDVLNNSRAAATADQPAVQARLCRRCKLRSRQSCPNRKCSR